MPVSDANEGISDECLMDAIVRGESAAMEMLYRRYSRLFFCMAYRALPTRKLLKISCRLLFSPFGNIARCTPKTLAVLVPGFSRSRAIASLMIYAVGAPVPRGRRSL